MSSWGSAGVHSTDTRDFAAHITVAKMSKMLGKKRKAAGKLKKIPEVCHYGSYEVCLMQLQ